MRIAIVGSGIAGLCCAHLLHREHEITVFESDSRLGGHAHTVDADHEGRRIPVDTGFIVYNERNYPGFCTLLARLGVPSQYAPMSFSVRRDETGFEFGGGSPLGLCAQPPNLLRPSYWLLLRDIARLGRSGKAMLAECGDRMTIGDLCASGRFSTRLLENYLLPMASAIWSAPRERLMGYPAKFFLRFFDNHGMLDLRERPRWRTISGGSREYVSRLVAPFRDRCRLACPVRRVTRTPSGVQIESGSESAGAQSSGGTDAPRPHPIRSETFDHVILACHSDQALSMLADARPAETEVLAEMPYQGNDTVLHRDRSALPKSRWAWAGWNYRVPAPKPGGAEAAPPIVTYNMTMLQSLETRSPLCVTLNDSASIDPAAVLGTYRYHHPQYTVPGIAARARWREISGPHTRTHFCGAYWFNGFHEDGVQSALRVGADFGVSL